MVKMKCTAYNNGTKITSAQVDGTSEAAARNSAMMKLSSDADIDWDSSDYRISCEEI